MMYSIVSNVIPSILDSDLARVMVALWIDGSDKRVFENEELIRRASI